MRKYSMWLWKGVQLDALDLSNKQSCSQCVLMKKTKQTISLKSSWHNVALFGLFGPRLLLSSQLVISNNLPYITLHNPLTISAVYHLLTGSRFHSHPRLPRNVNGIILASRVYVFLVMVVEVCSKLAPQKPTCRFSHLSFIHLVSNFPFNHKVFVLHSHHLISTPYQFGNGHCPPSTSAIESRPMYKLQRCCHSSYDFRSIIVFATANSLYANTKIF